MRVLQLHTPYRQPGGEDAVVRAEAEVLRRSGHEVVQYQVQNPPGAAGAIGSLVLSPWNPLQARRVQHLAERIRPDVAHVHNTWYAQSPAVLWALRRSGVPTVMTLHNYRLVCANGQLFRDGAPCEDCVGASPWHGVQHGCYRDSIVLSVPAAGPSRCTTGSTPGAGPSIDSSCSASSRPSGSFAGTPARPDRAEAELRGGPGSARRSRRRLGNRALRRPAVAREGRGAARGGLARGR